MIPIAIVSGLFDIGKNLIDKLIPDPAANAAAQLELMRLDQNGQLTQLQLQMSAILAEANSTDPWTSRARPSFMYLFYIVILAMVVIAPMVGIWFPLSMDMFFTNVSKGFNAIPSELWTTFTIGYVGYSASKTYEQTKGAKNPGK